MVLYHGSNMIVREPEIRMTKHAKDFGWGFYTTEIRLQAEQWAYRRAAFGGEPSVSSYEYQENKDLNIKYFDGINNEWLDFIAACRAGGTHPYDIVKGPMANDEIWDHVRDYLDGRMPREVFMTYAKFKKVTQQTTFHTMRALATLQFLGGEKL